MYTALPEDSPYLEAVWHKPLLFSHSDPGLSADSRSAYDPPEDEIITEEGMEELTPDNTYVQKEGDKYYMIYKNDKDEISKEDAEEMKMSGFEVKENEEK